MSSRVIEPDDTRLVDGFHDFEANNGIHWTDGNATVPTALFAGMNGVGMLLLHLRGSAHYVNDGHASRVA
jgi:hypothetical protein